MKDFKRDYRKIIAPCFFEAGFNPFSKGFNQKKVVNYINSFGSKNNSVATFLLKELSSLNELHNEVMTFIDELFDSVDLDKDEVVKMLVALINEQYFLVKKEIIKALPKENVSTFDFANATKTELNSNNPQPLQGLQEIAVDFLTILKRYVNFKPESGSSKKSDTTEEENIKLCEKIIHVTNEYYLIKTHFENCISMLGEINVTAEELKFYSSDSELGLSFNLSNTIIQNRSILSYFSFSNTLHNNSFAYLGKKNNLKILDEIVEDKGEYSFTLRNKQISEYHHLFRYEINIEAYYPHLKDKPVVKMEGLTFKDMIYLQESLSIFVNGLEEVIHKKKADQSIESICGTFAPRVKKKLILDYLLETSSFTESQINNYLELLENSGEDDFYGRPFLLDNKCYVFPILPIVSYNPYFLIDYWLEELDMSLDERGYEYEKIVKSRMIKIPQEKFNRFKVINPNNIIIETQAERLKQEIDLIVELNDCLIVGEIKCIKYPMTERDCFIGLNDRIDKAVKQLFVKERFLRNNKETVLEKYEFDAGKRIVKVIIVNYPIYNGYSVKGIPIIDFNSLLPYFNSDRAVLRAISPSKMEVVEEDIYYSSEKEFNQNLDAYLRKPSDFRHFEKQVEYKKLDYYLENLKRQVYFDDYRNKDDWGH